VTITENGVSITKDGFKVDGGNFVLWTSLYRVLEALPEVAHRRMGWFKIEGPPSKCVWAVDEAKAIITDLFPPTKKGVSI
jgi:hypothetical protein